MKTKRRLFSYLLATTTFMSLLGCATNPATGRRELILIPPNQEIALGIEAAPQFEQEFAGKVPNDALQQYVQSVGQKVAAHAERKMPYDFAVLASDVPNAFALPGGKIYITAGLLRLMSNERQLAGVLGHEIGHVTAGHSVQGMQRQMGAAVLVEVAKSAGGGKYGTIAGGAAQVTSSLVNLRYSRSQEYESDQLGIRYASRAGYNPWGVVELLNILGSLSESEPGRIKQMLQTHPVTSKRIKRAEETVQQQHTAFSPQQADPNASQFLKIRQLLPPPTPASK